MDFDEVLTSPAFYILSGLAVGATLIGYKLSQSWGTETFPMWQLIAIIVVEIIAAAFFATRE